MSKDEGDVVSIYNTCIMLQKAELVLAVTRGPSLVSKTSPSHSTLLDVLHHQYGLIYEPQEVKQCHIKSDHRAERIQLLWAYSNNKPILIFIATPKH